MFFILKTSELLLRHKLQNWTFLKLLINELQKTDERSLKFQNEN